MMHRFWYVYATAGDKGFLLDFILEAERAKLRLVAYAPEFNRVEKRYFDPTEASAGPGSHACRIAGATLHESGGFSDIAGLEFALDFSLEPADLAFGPPWLARCIKRVPALRSRYGWLGRAEVLGTSFRDLPLVYSTYTVRNIEAARWLLISALNFPDSDLRLEISAVRLVCSWFGAAIIRYQGRTYQLASLRESFHIRIEEAGTFAGPRRLFAVDLNHGELHMELLATAALSDFATLENDGKSTTSTSVFGDCEARVTLGSSPPTTHRATRTCLLEMKT